MILFASGRCDIPAFFSEWFYNRLASGFVDVRNPFNEHQISRIPLDEENVDVMIFCTKNPIPMIDRLHEISFPFLFHVTLTPYHQDIEQHMYDKTKIIKAIHTLSELLGRKRVIVRYDPILLTDRYTLSYHERAFRHLCEQVHTATNTIIISFVDMYKNTKANVHRMGLKEISIKEMYQLARSFGEIAKEYAIHVQTCAEKIDLSIYGVENKSCLDWKELTEAIGQTFPQPIGKGVRAQHCECLPSVDIGDYNCCLHQCLYCYANYQAKTVKERYKQHDPHSSVLIGHLNENDKIKWKRERKNRQISLDIIDS